MIRIREERQYKFDGTRNTEGRVTLTWVEAIKRDISFNGNMTLNRLE